MMRRGLRSFKTSVRTAISRAVSGTVCGPWPLGFTAGHTVIVKARSKAPSLPRVSMRGIPQRLNHSTKRRITGPRSQAASEKNARRVTGFAGTVSAPVTTRMPPVRFSSVTTSTVLKAMPRRSAISRETSPCAIRRTISVSRAVNAASRSRAVSADTEPVTFCTDRSQALVMSFKSRSSSTGFWMKSTAPSKTACTAISMSPCPVIKMTGRSTPCSFMTR